VKKYFVVAVLAMLCSVAGAQEQKAPPQPPASPAGPALKPEVKAAIRDLQWDQAKMVLQRMQMDQQLQNQIDAVTEQIRAKLASALEDSGIDKTKYDLNPDTLATTEKPAAAKPAPAPATAPTPAVKKP
jgi:mannitol-1-phosphate/altronate dehydrogenase